MNALYIGKEATPGGAVAAWVELPYAGESIDAAPSYSETNNVGATSRLPGAMTLESMEYAGSVNGDFAITAAMNILIESVMADDLATKTSATGGSKYKQVTLGKKQNTFAIAKVMDNADGTTKTVHTYKGCLASQMTIQSGESGAMTYTVNLLGQSRTVGTTSPTPVTAAGAYKVLTADKVVGLSVGTIVLSTECYKGMTLTINSNAFGNVCIGTSGNKSIDLGDVSATLETSLKFKNDQFTSLFDNQTAVALSVSAKAVDASYWDWAAKNAIVTAAPVNLPGKGEPFIISATGTVIDDGTADPMTMGTALP